LNILHETAGLNDASGGVVSILAVIQPHVADLVLEQLQSCSMLELTVRSVRGFGRQKNYLGQYRDTEYAMAFLPKVEIEIWAESFYSERIIRTIVDTARSGRMGDGKIFVLPVSGQGLIARTIDLAVD